MNFTRILRHLLMPPSRARRAFPPRTLAAIERAIRTAEARHGGQIRFAVEHALEPPALWRGTTARARAIEVFSRLRVWNTAQQSGVLLYVLLADRDVEIVADRGIDARVGAPGWEAICRRMEDAFRRGEFERGTVEGVEAVAAHLARHFPRAGRNELPDEPVVL